MKAHVEYETIVVDGEELRWKVRHSWVFDKDYGMKGLSVSVWRRPDRTRELILDFPFSLFGELKSPPKNAVIAALRPAIKTAIEGGWDPDSRGREFRYAIPD